MRALLGKAIRTSVSSLALSGVGLIAAASPAAAQDATAEPEAALEPEAASEPETTPEPEMVPDEIVVTATRRGALSTQDIGASVIALGEDQLEKSSAEGFNDYAKLVPGLTALSSGAGQTQIVLRGVNSGRVAHDNPEAQASVAVYINEIPVSTAGFNPDLNLFDLNRVEVLRGPQGTLFGAGAMSGAIRLITNAPNPREVEGKVEGTVSHTRHGDINYGAKGLINIPLVPDKLALRAVAYYTFMDGFIDDVLRGKDNYNREKTFGGRAALRWSGDRVDITATALYQKLNTDGRPDEFVPGSIGAFYARFAPLSSIVDFSDMTETTGPYQTSKFLDDTFNDELFIGNVTAEFDFDFAELISSSSLSRRKFENTIDDTPRTRLGLALALIGPKPPLPYTGISPFTNNVEAKGFTQEIRLQSTGQNRINWLAGAFYDKQNRDFFQLAAAPGAGLPVGLNGSTVPDALFQGERFIDSQQFAMFGEVGIELLKGLTATAGLRWFNFTQNIETIQRGGVITPAVGGTVQPESAKASGFTPKFQLDYRVNDDILLYATASKGFRLGESNSAIPQSTCGADLIAAGFPDGAPTSVAPDTLWNYEGGAKTEWFDKRLRANVSAYHIKWTGLPSAFRLPTCGFSFIANAGVVKTNGVELDFALRPFAGLSLGAGASILDSELSDPGLAFSPALVGSTPPYVPKFTMSASAEYGFTVGSAYTTIGASVRHVGKSYSEFSKSAAALVLPSYTVLDLNMNVEIDTLRVGLFAKNVTDERIVTNIDPERNLPAQYSLDRPRTVGLTVAKSF